MTSVTVNFLGGAREVGRSGYLIKHKGESALLDYGLQVTEPLTFPMIPEKVDSILLSHAHLDHCGGIPYLHKKKSFAVYGIDVSFDIAQLILHDSVKVNKIKKLSQAYSDADVDRIQESEITLQYGRRRKLGDAFSATFFDAGHIPGSAGILLEADELNFFYSGDTKYENTLLLSGAEYPKADVLISEATYGDTIHPERKKVISEFIGKIEETCDRGGVALVPAFAVGRSQEVLMMLDSLEYPIYLDGMAKAVVRLFLSYSEYLRDPDLLQKSANNTVWVYNSQMRKEVVKEPCIIVTTAGMLSGGPVLDYISQIRKDPKNSILLVGYQVKGTNGRLLLEEGYVIDPQKGKNIKVSTEVTQYDFSSHSGQDSLIKMADKVSPQKIILVHGEDKQCQALKEKLSEKYEVIIPENRGELGLQ